MTTENAKGYSGAVSDHGYSASSFLREYPLRTAANVMRPAAQQVQSLTNVAVRCAQGG
jgi:hypothetical protein